LRATVAVCGDCGVLVGERAGEPIAARMLAVGSFSTCDPPRELTTGPLERFVESWRLVVDLEMLVVPPLWLSDARVMLAEESRMLLDPPFS